MNQIKKSTLLTHPWLKDAPFLNPITFIYEEHNMDNAFLCEFNERHETSLPEGAVVLGWTDGSKVLVRPKPETIAVKIADSDFNTFWVHVI